MPENLVVEITNASFNGSFVDEHVNLSVTGSGDLIVTAEENESIAEVVALLDAMIAEEKEAEA